MEVNNELIEKLATLARLEFDDTSREAIKRFAKHTWFCREDK